MMADGRAGEVWPSSLREQAWSAMTWSGVLRCVWEDDNVTCTLDGTPIDHATATALVEAVMATEECRSCQAPVYWCEKSPVELNENGLPKMAPVDAGSVGKSGGKLEVWCEPVIPVSGGDPAFVLKFRYLRKGQNPAPGRQYAESHFSTCPQAGKWRRS